MHKSGLDAKIAIPVSMLYEYSGVKKFDSEGQFKKSLDSLKSSLNTLELEAIAIGYSNFRRLVKTS